MDPIILTYAEKTLQFTNRDITVDGIAYPYSGMTRLWHIPQRGAYAFQCEGQMVAFPYEEKDAALLEVLFARIAAARGIVVEDYPAAAPGKAPVMETIPTQTPATEEGGTTQPAPTAQQAPIAQPAPGIFSDRRFVIELIAGILLILIGVIGFVLVGR